MATRTRQLIDSHTRQLDPIVEAIPRPNWIQRFAIPLTILAWIGVVAVVVWAASHVIRSLLLLAISALLAFALAPVVKVFQRVMPRLLAILVVYLILLGALSALVYYIVRTAVKDVSSLSDNVKGLLNPIPGAPPTPLEVTLSSFGITSTQIQEARTLLINQASNLAHDAVPILKSFFDFMIDILLVAMLSIYLLLDGSRVPRWLRSNLPLRQRQRGHFLLDTMESVVGGYIRGQLTLAVLIAILVGGGMAILQVPYAFLLGVLAFIFAFIPVLGTFISAAACILSALTTSHSWFLTVTHSQSWVLALVVLAYFVFVHSFESHIVGPRIVGDSIGLHPIISVLVLIAGSELFGILGALFAVPIAGVIQAVLISLWLEWRANHPDQFPVASPSEIVMKGPTIEEEIEVVIGPSIHLNQEN